MKKIFFSFISILWHPVIFADTPALFAEDANGAFYFKEKHLSFNENNIENLSFEQKESYDLLDRDINQNSETFFLDDEEVFFYENGFYLKRGDVRNKALLQMVMNGEASLIDPSCRRWFSSSEVRRGDDCILECSLIDTDMGTFFCPNQCELLCNTKELISERGKKEAHPPLQTKKKPKILEYKDMDSEEKVDFVTHSIVDLIKKGELETSYAVDTDKIEKEVKEQVEESKSHSEIIENISNQISKENKNLQNLEPIRASVGGAFILGVSSILCTVITQTCIQNENEKRLEKEAQENEKKQEFEAQENEKRLELEKEKLKQKAQENKKRLEFEAQENEKRLEFEAQENEKDRALKRELNKK